jgi:hypothetical protein
VLQLRWGGRRTEKEKGEEMPRKKLEDKNIKA